MRILIVDIDLENLDQMTQDLLNIDPLYDITTCHASFDALTRIRKDKYDIIITEIYLTGGIQGNELMDSVPKNCFKIGMTGVLESPEIRKPFNHFMIKPVTQNMISEAIRMAEYNKQYLMDF